MSECANCGKKLNSLTKQYGISANKEEVLCGKCRKLLLDVLAGKAVTEDMVEIYHDVFVARGVTDAGLKHIQGYVDSKIHPEKFERNYYVFSALGGKAWAVTDDGLLYGKEIVPYSEIDNIKLLSPCNVPLTNGIITFTTKGLTHNLLYSFEDRIKALEMMEDANARIDNAHGVKKEYKYRLLSKSGSSLEVYDDYILIEHMPLGGIANVLRGGGTGKKRLNISEITSIQFKEPSGVAVGFIQFSYPGSIDNKGGVTGAVNDENSIVFEPSQLSLARQIVEYIEERRAEAKNPAPTQIVQQASAADEIKKFKELLDMGIITQEEFDAKKKQLLGL